MNYSYFAAKKSPKCTDSVQTGAGRQIGFGITPAVPKNNTPKRFGDNAYEQKKILEKSRLAWYHIVVAVKRTVVLVTKEEK